RDMTGLQKIKTPVSQHDSFLSSSQLKSQVSEVGIRNYFFAKAPGRQRLPGIQRRNGSRTFARDRYTGGDISERSGIMLVKTRGYAHCQPCYKSISGASHIKYFTRRCRNACKLSPAIT